MPEPGSLERAFRRRPYSPYADRSFAASVYWGDTQLHTGFASVRRTAGKWIPFSGALAPVAV
jgi:hypothetical protein